MDLFAMATQSEVTEAVHVSRYCKEARPCRKELDVMEEEASGEHNGSGQSAERMSVYLQQHRRMAEPMAVLGLQAVVLGGQTDLSLEMLAVEVVQQEQVLVLGGSGCTVLPISMAETAVVVAAVVGGSR